MRLVEYNGYHIIYSDGICDYLVEQSDTKNRTLEDLILYIDSLPLYKNLIYTKITNNSWGGLVVQPIVEFDNIFELLELYPEYLL